MNQVEDALALLERATTPDEVFGAADPAAEYRRLAKLLHPDRHVGDDRARERASAAFARLSAFYARLTGKEPAGPLVIATKRATYTVQREPAHEGELANLYRCSWLDGADEPASGLLKMPRSPKSSDLMQREALSLKRVHASGDERLRAFAPELLGTLRHRDTASGAERRCNVLPALDGWYTLAQVHAAYPAGLDGRDAAWIWRRLFAALALPHSAGIVHGAPWPEHVLIHPEMHGLMLVGWCHSTELGSPLRARSRRWANLYPPEVKAGQAATEATDVYIACGTMAKMLDPRARSLHAFARGCMLERESMRPHDVRELTREFDDLIERLYGPRKFRPFTMPTERESNHG